MVRATPHATPDMSSSGGAGEEKTSRRRYIKLLGSLVAVGAVGTILVDVADQVLGSSTVQTVTDMTTQTSTTTSTAIVAETLTNTQTEIDSITNTAIDTRTLTDTQTETTTETEIESVTQTQTDTQTLISTQTETVTDAKTEVVVNTQTDTSSVTASSSTSTSTVEIPPATPGFFSIFWITDTQFLSEANPTLFGNLTDWIAGNWGPYNGKMVVHTGDIVQTGDNQAEWENANLAMTTLVQNQIPYTWCAGNHDDLVGGDSTSGWMGNIWAPTFDPDVVSGQVNALGYASWVGDYHDGMNTAVAFSANGLNFLVVNIEWNAQPDVLEWVEGLLEDPERAGCHVIIAPHAYINSYGVIPDSSNDIDLTSFNTDLTTLMDNYSPNVFLTLNGHYGTDCGYNTQAPIMNRNQLMFDRQDCADEPGDPTGQGVDASTSSTPDVDKVGGATVTILTFDITDNQIYTSTYDVNTGMWRNDPFEQYSIAMLPNTPPNGT
jgi:hypothetical protein